MNGLLLVDKPSGMTSHDVVDRIRKVTGIRKIGHTGTLDPSATGMLILCIGKATRLSEFLTGLDKVYEGDMRLGVVTDSFDMDGKILEENPVPELDIRAIQTVCDQFTGDIEQVPPMVSAVKVGGERLYKRARKGETVERKPRPVTVNTFEVLDWNSPLAHFRVSCTRGTYVRSLCHDVGAVLGCGATVDSLRRTSVGKHAIGNARPLDHFESRSDVEERLMRPGDALELPEVVVLPSGRRQVETGGLIRLSDLKSRCAISEGFVQVMSCEGELLALAEFTDGPGGPCLQPRRVFAAAG